MDRPLARAKRRMRRNRAQVRSPLVQSSDIKDAALREFRTRSRSSNHTTSIKPERLPITRTIPLEQTTMRDQRTRDPMTASRKSRRTGRLMTPVIDPLVLSADKLSLCRDPLLPVLAFAGLECGPSCWCRGPASTSGTVNSKKSPRPKGDSSQVSNGMRCKPVEGESRPRCCFMLPPKHYSNHTLLRCGNCGKKQPQTSACVPGPSHSKRRPKPIKYANTELLAPPRKVPRSKELSYEGPVGFTYPPFEDAGVPQRVSKRSGLLLPWYEPKKAGDYNLEDAECLDWRRDDAAWALIRRYANAHFVEGVGIFPEAL
jgi:hypothetical protein